MTYLQTPAESPLYPPDEAHYGYVPNFTKIFALQPQVYPAWQQLIRSVRAGLDDRRYELITVAAAVALGSRYCSLAHAAVLQDRFYAGEALRAVIADHHQAGLDDAEVAMMDFAALVAKDPTAVTERDAEKLRREGFSDADILQIVLVVCARRFFSGVLSAVGAEPDAFERLDAEVRTELTA